MCVVFASLKMHHTLCSATDTSLFCFSIVSSLSLREFAAVFSIVATGPVNQWTPPYTGK